MKKTEDKPQLDESPPPSSQDPSHTDQETTASAQKAKTQRTFLEVVPNDAQVSSPQTEQPDAQEKKAAHVARREAMIKMADSPETIEIHKSLTAESARVTKTAKSQPNSVRLAWIAQEERRLSELEADICKVTEALKTPRVAVQEEKKAVDALKLENVQNQTVDDPMGTSSLDDLERKELNILREYAAAAISPVSPSQTQENEQERNLQLIRSLSEVQSKIAVKKQRVA